MSLNQQYADSVLTSFVDFHRQTTRWLLTVIEVLRQLESDVFAALLFESPSDKTQARSRMASLSRLMARIEKLIKKAYAEIESRFDDYIDEVYDEAVQQDKKRLVLLFGVSFKNTPTLSGSLLVSGLTLMDWLNSQAQSQLLRLQASISSGVNLRRSTDDILKGLQGKFPESPVPIFSTAEQALKKLGQSTTTAALEQAQKDTVEVNIKEVEPLNYGWQHISVLDNRTSMTCRARAFKTWDKDKEPIGHTLPFALPPLHPNCRSRMVMTLLDLNSVPEQTFKQWVATQSEAQLEKMFGKAKLKLWREGKISDTELLGF